ncbi:DUF3108 domain-containing protein [Puteibacter caeruleilacunae]|nr:DUF3108 domain-containing protein [Puteibacter caeruleilacunae]
MRNVLTFILIVVVALGSFKSEAADKERLEFVMRFGFIRGGKATFVANDTLFDGKMTTHLKVRGRSVGIVDALYKVDDIYESWVDPATNLPLKAIRNVKEKNYRYYNETLFYHEKDSAYSQKSGWRAVDDNITDMLSVFYYFRGHELLTGLEKGDKFSVPLWHSDKIYKIDVIYLGKKDLQTRFGKINCFVLAPQVKKGKIFKKTDALTVWISNDRNKVPLLLDLDIKVGSLKCELVEYVSPEGFHLK